MSKVTNAMQPKKPFLIARFCQHESHSWSAQDGGSLSAYTSLADLLDTYKPLIENAIGLLDLIAAMALIASLVTLANTIALEMLERRRELGILKAIGHASRSVFSEVLLENGLIGLTGGVVGMALVLVLAPIVNGSRFSSLAQFDMLVAVPWAVGIMLAAIAICLLVAAGVSWNATCVRPLEVLRYE